jgi:hypothetical protein
MPAKRPVSDLSDDDIDEDDRVVKKQKPLPLSHQVKLMIEDILNLLTPTTSQSLADFNSWERAQKQRGVTPIDTDLLQMELGALQAKNVDAKLKAIDSDLEQTQVVYSSYIADAATRGDGVPGTTLNPAIRRIQMAREKLPGMRSYWMN